MGREVEGGSEGREEEGGREEGTREWMEGGRREGGSEKFTLFTTRRLSIALGITVFNVLHVTCSNKLC